MSLALKFSVNTGDCTSLKVTDVTGIYSNVNPENLTGWGSPNASTADVTGGQGTATLTITTKDSAIPYVIDVISVLPNTTGAIYTVLPTQIGYTASIPTQILKIVYTVTGIYDSGSPFTFSTWCLILVGCDLTCCVEQLQAAAAEKVMCSCQDICKCTCDNCGETYKAMQAFILLSGLRIQVRNKLINQAKFTLSVLSSLCNCK